MAGAAQAEAREVMDIRQAAAYLGISADSLYRYASEGTVPAFRLGNRWRFKRSLLDAWMVEQSSPRTGRVAGAQPGAEVSVLDPAARKPVARVR